MEQPGGHQVITDILPTGGENPSSGTPISSTEVARIRSAIKEKYKNVSRTAAGFFKYPVGREGAKNLGYRDAIVDCAPDYLVESFCGVGNPFLPGPIKCGSTVLDIGCGAGFDMYVAASFTTMSGTVEGVDLTGEMVAKARKNLQNLGLDNCRVHLVDTEVLPFDDERFDTVISNGAINLSPYKDKLFDEIFRVLKNGGRLQFADIILDKDLPPEVKKSSQAWSE
ncbi:Methyltransferase domain-containing protein [Desulforhopalus singaporensis]|uniref:Arsenite methyltransferase n=1 Tax=Desulforhopalus singaporensis TaxID=91360 RepID=A0A1H0J3D5_9BACT|nr:methyltransferase domain-containing protein [Desulforhopalus singaporensis]SDO37851.1 Methyltransferase domain-containing protein [Desulforhopalus singaporensis]